MDTKHTLIDKIKYFLETIGLKVEEGEIPESTFVPGIHILNGTLWIDRSKLTYPGDLLHEAGHLALMEPEKRVEASGDLEPGNGITLNADSLEVGVILWTYAAIVELGIDPKIVFHDEGYRGASDWYIDTFSSGNYVGLPLLQWMGLCKNSDEISSILPFPHMIKWVRS